MREQSETSAPHAAMLPEYLSAMAERLYKANCVRRQELTSADQWLERQVQLRQFFTDAVGGFPDRTPLNPRTTGVLEGDGFTIEKLMLESRPDLLVTANLYLPRGLGGPVPGVLIPCGHSANGKASEAYQKVAISLALSGMVALIYDPVSQGERVQYYDQQLGESTVGSCTLEHSQMDNQCYLIGHSIAGYRIYDGMRCLDYLQSRPEVDPDRLGCTGCSGGGTMTTYLMSLDERIRVAMPVCYITTLQARQASDRVADGEQNIHGQLAFGMDHHEMAAMTAPRALRIGAAEEDYFPLDGARATAEFCTTVYRLMGAEDLFNLFIGPGGHGYSDHMRHAALEWFGRHFDIPMSEADPGDLVRPDEELYCTDAGQVVTATVSRKVFQVNIETFDKLKSDLTQVLPAKQLRGMITQALHLSAPVRIVDRKPFHPSAAGIEPAEDTDYHVLTVEEGLHAGLFVKRGSGQAGAVRLLVTELPDYSGFAEAEATEGEHLALLSVCGTGVSDLRGHGLAMYEQQGGNLARLHGREVFASNYAKLMGFSLLRLRVADILGALDFLRGECGYHEVVLEGHGRGGIWALHAAVLDGRVTRVRLVDTLWSYELTLRDGEYLLPHTADIARGCLLQYDLPQLCAALAPAPLEIVRPLDSRGHVHEVAGTREFGMLQQAYRAAPDSLVAR